jgi:hypothetical protein
MSWRPGFSIRGDRQKAGQRQGRANQEPPVGDGSLVGLLWIIVLRTSGPNLAAQSHSVPQAVMLSCWLSPGKPKSASWWLITRVAPGAQQLSVGWDDKGWKQGAAKVAARQIRG